MTALYNEIDAAALAALAEVMADGIIAPGRIEPRSIKELTADDIEGYTQVHLFAGAGSWSAAARLAGWPDDWPLWSVSCPCQPFSQAGKRAGVDDPRHLWPDVFRLARAARPACIVGEQVAGAAGYDWFHRVGTDLGFCGYASWVVDIPAAAVDAPHIRQRLYWVAVRGDLADAAAPGEGWRQLLGPGQGSGTDRQRAPGEFAGPDGGNVGDAVSHRCDGPRLSDVEGSGLLEPPRPNGRESFWSDHAWLPCHDGKARRVPKSSLRDVAHGILGADDPGDHARRGEAQSEQEEAIDYRLLTPSAPGRIDAWKIAGNAIVAPLAVEVIAALKDVMEGR